MAARSGGFATFINAPSRLQAIFHERFKELSDVVARSLRIGLRTHDAAKVQNVFRLTPDITLARPEDGELMLGDLEAERPVRVLVELLVSGTQPGALRLMRIGVSGELLGTQSQARAEAEAEVDVTITESGVVSESAPQEIVDMVARIAAYQIQEKVMADIAKGETERATNRLKNLATHLMNFGEAELARAALLEAGTLAGTGKLSTDGPKRMRYGTRALSGTAILGAREK